MLNGRLCLATATSNFNKLVVINVIYWHVLIVVNTCRTVSMGTVSAQVRNPKPIPVPEHTRDHIISVLPVPMSRPTPTSHNTKHMENMPVWARFLCLGLPLRTPPPTTRNTQKARLFGHVFHVWDHPPPFPPSTPC